MCKNKKIIINQIKNISEKTADKRRKVSLNLCENEKQNVCVSVFSKYSEVKSKTVRVCQIEKVNFYFIKIK